MRAPSLWFAGCVAAALLTACASPTGPRACMTVDTACLSGPPSMKGLITQVTFRPGAAQRAGSYDLWVAVEPSAVANAAVILDEAAPVFVRLGGGPRVASSAAALKPGDPVELWVTANFVDGSPDAPPSAPLYGGQQVVVAR